VRFVDHEDLEAADRRFVGRAFQQVANLVDAAVAGGVELDVVDIAVGVDLGTGAAHVAGRGRDAAAAVGPGAVEALGQDARDGGLADAARAREQVGVVQAFLIERVGQRAHHGVLAHHLGKRARPVLAREHDITHAPILRAGRCGPAAGPPG
jgi:hypothetical protein